MIALYSFVRILPKVCLWSHCLEPESTPLLQDGHTGDLPVEWLECIVQTFVSLGSARLGTHIKPA